ncbi:MAG TPA: FHA domain-containing protein [Blastocatellia bacterium]|nr:FHA domain-containing protein [Blastocatellia bacterium]
MSKFIVIRKDLDLDPVVIESEGLTLGRLTGNDLALDHPDVSGVHAAIEGADGDYWVFNLSEESGTLLNDEQIEQGPLADGDVIQIGPYFLSLNYAGADLRLEVELSADPRSDEASGEPQILASGDGQRDGARQGITIRFDPTWLTGRLEQLQRDEKAPNEAKPKREGRSLSGRLTGKHALKIFWDKRKREGGKLVADSTVKLIERRFGKAQFNWYPTRDLQAGRTIPLFMWGTLIVAALALTATFAFQEIYSPGALSSAHARDKLSISPAIAKNINSATCSTCHSSQASMNQNCASCHTTKAFHSDVSEKHLKASLTCVDCHSEHHGRDFSPSLVANVACVGCHRDGGGFVSPLDGRMLKTPHGGTFGYPLDDGRWSWDGVSQSEWQRKELPGMSSQFGLKEQFHLIHVAGRQGGRSDCADCHRAGFEGDAVTKGVRESCADCHGTDDTAARAQADNARLILADKGANRSGSVRPGAPLCVSCHSQHGEEKDLRMSLRRMER